MDVKTAGRVIDLFEVFASLKRPATLSELSRNMEIPVSRCFNLLKTIENRGYLYAVKPRGGVYPTKRILELARVIAANDPIASRVSPVMQAWRDESGERWEEHTSETQSIMRISYDVFCLTKKTTQT